MTITLELEQANNSVCSHCGAHFECGAKAGKETCWCFSLPPVVPQENDDRCLCPTCLNDRIRLLQERR
ncbi:MAG: cysteine-rich CWC family protein [Bacteroidota bacterium]